METRVESDAGWVWVAYAFWFVRFAAVGGLLALVGTSTGDLRPTDALIGGLLVSVVATLVVGTMTALWWRVGPGRVAYMVRGGELVIFRGRRVVRRYPCKDITDIRISGALTWSELLLRNWFGHRIENWPTLSIDLTAWPTGSYLVGPRDQAGILLWGTGRARQAEEDLRRAAVLNGAALAE